MPDLPPPKDPEGSKIRLRKVDLVIIFIFVIVLVMLFLLGRVFLGWW
ncbi:MAG: hypothetical protein V1725_07690 [archaeon]